MAVTLGDEVLGQYRRFSLYNSPYTAHDRGCAVDLYPAGDDAAPSPVAGTVRDVRSVRAPPKPYAAEKDHLLLVDVAPDSPGFRPADAADSSVARLLHVDPTVDPGDEVAVGDPLGELVRAGFFAPWVDNHVHLEFRPADADHYRASGSVRIGVDVPVAGLDWDGRGTVGRTGDTYAVLDAPAHPDPGSYFAGVAADGGGVLDGGLPHYDGGGLLSGPPGPVALAGDRIGTADGRDVAWDAVAVRVDGTPITGLSLFLARDADFGAKLICPEATFPVGREVQVTVTAD